MGCYPFPCLFDAWERYNKHVMQYIHRGALHWGHRLPNMWAQGWQDMQTTKSSPWRCVIWYKVQVVMGVLPPFSHVLWMYGKGPTSLGCNTYKCMPSIQAIDHQSYGPRFRRGVANHQAIPTEVWVVIQCISVHGLVVIFSTYLVGTWEWSDTCIITKLRIQAPTKCIWQLFPRSATTKVTHPCM